MRALAAPGAPLRNVIVLAAMRVYRPAHVFHDGLSSFAKGLAGRNPQRVSGRGARPSLMSYEFRSNLLSKCSSSLGDCDTSVRYSNRVLLYSRMISATFLSKKLLWFSDESARLPEAIQ